MINNGFEERSEDRRIRKTKKALRAALVRLLSKESIAEITIKELTDEAVQLQTCTEVPFTIITAMLLI